MDVILCPKNINGVIHDLFRNDGFGAVGGELGDGGNVPQLFEDFSRWGDGKLIGAPQKIQNTQTTFCNYFKLHNNESFEAILLQTLQ